MRYTKYLIWLTFLIVGIVFGSIANDLYNKSNEASLKEKASEKENSSSEMIKEYSYDCEYSKTFHLVDRMDDYVYEIPEMNYILVDQFLDKNPVALLIEANLKKDLEIGKWYVITFKMNRTINVKLNYEETAFKFSEIIRIEETDNIGMLQVNDNFCEAK